MGKPGLRKSIDEFMSRHRLVAELPMLRDYAEEFVREMERGLAGEKSSLLMIPTYIQDGEGLDFDQDVIVIDAGGTNLRIALVRLSTGGVPEIKYFEKYPMLGRQGEITIDAFFDGLAAYLAPVAGAADHIGMCFSFPAEVLPNRDAKILTFDKEVRISGASGALLGEGLRAALRRRGLPFDKSVVVINDTVASQLGAMAEHVADGAFGAYIGLILGTGLNSCYTEKNAAITKAPDLAGQTGGTIINMESGGFGGILKGDIDETFIAATEEPELQHMEKMSSGAYQGGLLLRYIQAGAREGCFTDDFCGRVSGMAELSGIDIDRFCDAPFGENPLAALCGGEEDTLALYRLTDRFFERVALLAAVNLTGILIKMGDVAKNPLRPVCISAEGTTFYKARLLRPKLDYFMAAGAERQMGLYSRFVRVENATITGSAFAGLLGNR